MKIFKPVNLEKQHFLREQKQRVVQFQQCSKVSHQNAREFVDQPIYLKENFLKQI